MSAHGYEAADLAGLRVTGNCLGQPDADLRLGEPRLAQGMLQPRHFGEVAASDAGNIDAALGLPDLVLPDRAVAGQGAADHVRVDGHAAVAEYLIGPPVDAGAQPAGR